MMGKPGTSYVIEIATGSGEPASIPLFRGQELSPISVGKKGMWRVESTRTLDVHAFLYFDGDSLFVQSADQTQPAVVDGKRIGKTWTELRVSCTIELGGVRLRYRALAGANVNAAVPMPPSAPTPAALPIPEKPEKPEKPGKRPFASGAFAPTIDLESTRVAPLNAESHEQEPPTRRAVSPRPAAGRPVSEDQVETQAPHQGRGGVHLRPTPTGRESTAVLSSLTDVPTRIAPPLPINPRPATAPMGAAPTAPPPVMQSRQSGYPGNYGGNYPQAPQSPQSPQSPYAPHPEYPYSPNASAFAQTRLGSIPPAYAFRGAGSMGPHMPNQGSIPPQVQAGGAQSTTASAPGQTGLAAKWKAWRAKANATPPKTPNTPGAAPAEAPGDRSGTGPAATWKSQIPAPRVLLMFLVVVALALYLAFDDDKASSPSQKAAATSTQPTPSASAPVVPPPASASPASVPDVPVAQSVTLPPVLNVEPTGSTVAPPAAPPGNRLHASDAGALADGGKGKNIDTATSASSKTLERQAVDAYAAGDFALAAQRYTELAKSDPSNPAYEQAARIARMRLDAGPGPGK